jgi:GNAT superfamily N-acetyltransferase
MDVHIREAREKDLEAVLAVYADAGIDGDRHLPLGDAQTLFRRMEQYPDYALYVAECAGVICGTFALLIMDNLANGGMPSGIAEDVAVAQHHQGHGVGKAMMRHALETCRSRGCYKLALSSNRKRADSHGFYEALGFERHGFSFRADIA